MPPPVFTTGQVLDAPDVNTWFVPLAAYKASNTDRTTTTMSGDPDLTVPVAANAWYFVDVFLAYLCTSTTPRFKFTWLTPSGSGAASYHALYVGTGGVQVNELDLWTETHTAAITTASVTMGMSIRGTLLTGGTAGNFQLSWAADSTAAAMTLAARSILKLTRVG